MIDMCLWMIAVCLWISACTHVSFCLLVCLLDCLSIGLIVVCPACMRSRDVDITRVFLQSVYLKYLLYFFLPFFYRTRNKKVVGGLKYQDLFTFQL